MKRHVIFIVEGEDDDRTFARESHPSLTSVKKGFDVLLGMSAKVYSSNAVTVKRSEQQKRNIIIIIIIIIVIIISDLCRIQIIRNAGRHDTYDIVRRLTLKSFTHT